MDNELNQVPTNDDDLFSDIVDENENFDDVPEASDEFEDTPVEEEVSEQAEEAPFLEVIYNKEKKGLSRD